MARDIRKVPLSAQQVIAIFLVIAAAIVLLVLVSAEGAPAHVHAVRTANGLLLIALTFPAILLFYWHHRLASRPDIHPDILAQLYSPDGVFELDTLHFQAFGRQRGRSIRVLVLLQNVYAGHCNGQLDLQPLGNGNEIPNAHLPLAYELDAGEVAAFYRDIPLPPTFPRELTYAIAGFLRFIRAPRVRFQRRLPVSSGTPLALTTAGVVLGHVLYHSSGTRLNIPLIPPSDDIPAPDPPAPLEWQRLTLWSPNTAHDLPTIRAILQRLDASPS